MYQAIWQGREAVTNIFLASILALGPCSTSPWVKGFAIQVMTINLAKLLLQPVFCLSTARKLIHLHLEEKELGSKMKRLAQGWLIVNGEHRI